MLHRSTNEPVCTLRGYKIKGKDAGWELNSWRSPEEDEYLYNIELETRTDTLDTPPFAEATLKACIILQAEIQAADTIRGTLTQMLEETKRCEEKLENRYEGD